METIGENELIKLLDILRDKKIETKTILHLCKVNKLLDLSMQQYNLLLYVLLKR